ncbi:MAG: hypothetical protein JEZ07_12860 [Phycisphaerae bacterium]|nr:hypothetical protein [Phycisphaerae bacterium]
MKAEERENLKKNELNEMLLESAPTYIKENKNKIIMIAMSLVAIVCLYYYFQNLNYEARQAIINNSDMAISERYVAQNVVANSSQKALSEKNLELLKPYQIDTVQDTLDSVATDDDFAAMALYQKAEIARAKIYFAGKTFSPADKTKALDDSEKLYTELSGYSNSFFATGQGQLGLGLIAEERGQWDKATKIYQGIIADKKLANTAFPGLALGRLDIMDELKESKVEFAEDPQGPELPAEITTPTDMP